MGTDRECCADAITHREKRRIFIGWARHPNMQFQSPKKTEKRIEKILIRLVRSVKYLFEKTQVYKNLEKPALKVSKF